MSKASGIRWLPPRVVWLPGCVVLVVALLAGALLLTNRTGGDRVSVTAVSQAAQQQARRAEGQRFWQAHGRELLAHLRQADDHDVNAAVAAVDSYFKQAQQGAGNFSDAVLSWEAKWYLVTAQVARLLHRLERLPSWLKARWIMRPARQLAILLDRRGFQRFVHAEFNKHIFSEAGMERVVRQAVAVYHRRSAAREQALLATFADPSTKNLAHKGRRLLRAADTPRRYEALHQSIVRDTLSGSNARAEEQLLRDITQRVSSKVLVALAAYAFKEGAVELGLLSAATASTLWSFGVGLAVVALGNLALQYILKKVGKPPRDALQKRLATEISAIRRCVLEGCKRPAGAHGKHITVLGLRPWLQRYRAHKQKARQRALRTILQGDAPS